MKKDHKSAFLSVAVIILAVIICSRVPASASPGDASDPLVSKSYVDGQFDLLRALIGNAQVNPGTGGSLERELAVAEVLAYIEAVYGETLRQIMAEPSYEEKNAFEIIQTKRGQTLIALAGAEVILRSGGAVAVSGENGFCDITAGADIQNGTAVKLNHLLLTPRSDGRGMRFTDDSFLMIKGGYYIVD